MFYYYDKEKIKTGITFCLYQSETKLRQEEIDNINKTQNNLLGNYIEYFGEIPFIGYPILTTNNEIRRATDRELVNLGKVKLGEGERLSGDSIEYISKPSDKYKWDYVLLKWMPDETKIEDGEYIKDGTIIDVPRLPDAISQEWDKQSHTWIDTTTSAEIARKQYLEYKPLDTPLLFISMEKQGIKAEYVDMMTQLQSIMSSTPSSSFTKVVIPKPSQKLIDFKNIINKIGG